MPDTSEDPVVYTHDSNCSKTNFTPLNGKGLKTCIDCAGVFDRMGKGVQVDSKKFDSWRSDQP